MVGNAATWQRPYRASVVSAQQGHTGTRHRNAYHKAHAVGNTSSITLIYHSAPRQVLAFVKLRTSLQGFLRRAANYHATSNANSCLRKPHSGPTWCGVRMMVGNAATWQRPYRASVVSAQQRHTEKRRRNAYHQAHAVGNTTSITLEYHSAPRQVLENLKLRTSLQGLLVCGILTPVLRGVG